MIEHHYYECETCGKTFKDAGECGQHEMSHRIEEVKEELQCYDYEGDKVEIEPTFNCLNDIWYVEIRTADALHLIKDLYDLYSTVDSPGDLYISVKSGCPIPTLRMYRTSDSGNWRDLDSAYKKLNDITDIFEKNN